MATCNPRSHFKEWYHIALVYSKRSMIFEMDELPAISGLARLFGGHVGVYFVAGLG